MSTSNSVDTVRIQIVDARSNFLANGKVWLYAHSTMHGVMGMLSLDKFGDDWLWVNDLFVPQEFRRRGIARALLECLHTKPLDLNDNVLGFTAAIAKENSASRSLFEACGYSYCYDYPNEGPAMYSRPRALKN